jgi:hypothetical protein
MGNQKQTNAINTTKERNKIFFCVNLNDEINEQVFHLEHTDLYRFALMGIVKGTNPPLSFGTYKIQEIQFHIKIFNEKPKLYIREVKFDAFVENENGIKNTAKFKVDVSLDEQPTSRGIYTSPDLKVKDDAILDMDFISTDNPELNRFLQEQKKKANDTFNFGGHICKSRVAF